jgi:hypothetical protein
MGSRAERLAVRRGANLHATRTSGWTPTSAPTGFARWRASPATPDSPRRRVGREVMRMEAEASSGVGARYARAAGGNWGRLWKLEA